MSHNGDDKYLRHGSTAHVGGTHSRRVQADLLCLVPAVVDAQQPRLLEDLLELGVDGGEGVGEGDGHALGLTVDAAADDRELEVPLPRRFGVDEGLEHLAAVVDISAVVSEWLVVDNHLPISLGYVHLCLATLPLAVAEVAVGHFSVGLLDLIEGILGLFEGEELELHLWADGAVSDVVLVHPLPVLVEDAEVVEVGVPVEVHGHLVERELHGGRGRELHEFALAELDAVHCLFLEVLSVEDLLHVQLGPDQHFLAHDPLLNRRCRGLSQVIVCVEPVLRLVLHDVGHDLDRYFLECDVDLLVDVLEVGLDHEVVLLVLMQEGVDDLVLVADVHGQVVGSDHRLHLDLLLLLHLVEGAQEEELVDALLDVPVLGLERSVACNAGLHLSREAAAVVEVEVGVDRHCFLDCLSVLGVVGGDEGAVGHRLLVYLLLDLGDLAVEVLQDPAEGDLLQLLLGDLAAFPLERALRSAEEGLDFREGEVGVALARTLPLLDEPDEGVVDQQPAQSVLHVLLLQRRQVKSEDLDQLDLGLGLELTHEGHGQVLELPDHVVSDLLLPLEDLDEAVEVLVQAQRKPSLLVELIIALLLVVVPLQHWLEVDIVFDLLLEPSVALLIIDGELTRLDVLVLDVVDVEVLLPQIGVDGVELEEVLAADGLVPEAQEGGMQQPQHHLVVVK